MIGNRIGHQLDPWLYKALSKVFGKRGNPNFFTLMGFFATLIAALFIVGEGLSRTGVTAYVGDRLIGSAKGSPIRLLVLSMLATAVLSGVISNAGTVAALMPAVVVAAWGVRSSPAAFLIPVAFAANAGGLLTLTGTPPNIVIADALAAAGFRTFGFFEFSLIGVPLLVVTIGYMAIVGRRLLPTRKSGAAPPILDREMVELAEAYSLDGELYRLRVRRASPLRGETLRSSDLGRRYGITVLRIESHGTREDGDGELRSASVRQRIDALAPDALPDPDAEITYNDILTVSASPDAVRRLELEMVLGVLPVEDALGCRFGFSPNNKSPSSSRWPTAST